MTFDQTLDRFLEKQLQDSNEAFEYQFGYTNFGPFLYGFSLWLKEKVDEKKIDKIFFLSRDGKILKSAFDLLFPEEKGSFYLYSSRRSWLFPTFAYEDRIENCLRQIFQNRRDFSYVLKNLGLEEEDYCHLSKNQLETSFSTIDALLNDAIFMSELEAFFPKIKEKAEGELTRLVKYLKQEGLSGSLALVDIGWYGRSQEALEKISQMESLNLEISGLYTGLRTEHARRAEGYLFRHQKSGYYENKFRGAIQAYESLFIGNEGSCLSFKEVDGKVFPLQEKWTEKEEEIFSKNFEIQKGALAFLKDFNQSGFSENYQNKTENFWFRGLEKSLVSGTSLALAQELGKMRLDHGAGDIKYLAAAKSFSFYLFHPKEFQQDISRMVWLSGFMTQLFKIKAPYYLFLRILKK